MVFKAIEIAAAVLLIGSGYLSAETGDGSLSEAIEAMTGEVERASDELRNLREEIARKKIPLAGRLREARDEVVSLRKEAGALRTLAWQKESGFARLKEEVAYLEEEAAFASSLLTEYRRDMVKRMSAPEEAMTAAEHQEIDRLLRSETSADSLRALRPLLELATGLNRLRSGGYAFGGECLDGEGLLHPGRFAQVGPMAYFVSEDGSRAGIVGLNLGSTRPSIVAATAPGPIREVVAGNQDDLPVDPTLGEAIKIRRGRRSWGEHIKAGGIIMVPILCLGFFCLIVAAGKFIYLGRLETDVAPVIPDLVERLERGDVAGAEAEARALGPPAGPVLREGIEHRSAPREHLEEIMHERILAQIPGLEKWLPFLAVAAAAAPLLGLLGTVTGMIHTFNMVTIFGSGKAKLLSGGISEALITTEYGLIIAIPALLAHAYLSRRVRKLINNLDHGAVAFINAVKLKGANGNRE